MSATVEESPSGAWHGAADTGTSTRTHVVTPVDLAPFADNIAMTTLQTLDAGALNVWGNSLPAGTLPAAGMAVAEIRFRPLPADGRHPDNVRCAGQYLRVPATGADWLHLLAASERRCEETVHLHYSSGAVEPEWLRVSDLWPAHPHFGERLAARAVMHYPHHRQDDVQGQIWAMRVPVVRREPLVAIRLPDNPAVHVFALSVEEVR